MEQLKANQGKKIVLELVNGRVVTGTVLTVDQQHVRVGTDEGVGTIPVDAIQIVWETSKRSLTDENMESIAEKLRDSVKAEIACTGFEFTCRQQYICRPPDYCTGNFSCPFSYVPFQGGSQCPVVFGCPGTQFYGVVGPTDMGTPPEYGMPVAGQAGYEDVKAEIACTAFPGFTCARSYICRPPDSCSFSFACPGSYVPSFPSGGGGGCPTFFCGPFQFGQPCRPPIGCGPFQFGPCRPPVGCGPFQFGQPCRPPIGCGPFQFGQPCRPPIGCGPFQFGQPCRPFPVGCGPFQFGGSQCGVPGGFVCAGQQFIGVVGAPGPTGTTATADMPPVPPAEFSVKKEDQGKEK